MKADVYLAGDDELHRWAFAHRRRVRFEGRDLPLAPPEYVIVTWGSISGAFESLENGFLGKERKP